MARNPRRIGKRCGAITLNVNSLDRRDVFFVYTKRLRIRKGFYTITACVSMERKS